MVHATNHTKALNDLGEKMEGFKPEFEVKSAIENVKDAIAGETYESTEMYPEFIGTAKSEKARGALKSFTWALDTEKKHRQFYSDALQSLVANKEADIPSEYAVCPVCGNTYTKAGVDVRCAFCKTPREKFIYL